MKLSELLKALAEPDDCLDGKKSKTDPEIRFHTESVPDLTVLSIYQAKPGFIEIDIGS